MYKRLSEHSPESFETHELLEMLLYSSYKRADTNEIAHELIDRFGSLAGVFSASEKELMEVPGVGLSTARMIAVIRANVIRLLSESARKGEDLSSARAMMEYCTGLFKFVDTEQLRIIYLDGSYRFVAQELISSGTIEQVRPDVMRIIERTVQKRCPVVLLTHNHPKSSEMPSTEDKILTRNIFNLLDKAGVYLADHIIVGMHGTYSMRSNGLLPDIWD